LRYARLRNPAKPAPPATPSFQAVIPADAQSQSNWGQPPAGWGAPTVPVEPPTAEPAPAAEPEPAAPMARIPLADAPAPAAPMTPVAPSGLPDPANRTPYVDQWAVPANDQWSAPKSSLDWRATPRPSAPPPAPSGQPVVDPDHDTGVVTRSGLPSRTPQRLARSTEPARTPLDWKPQRLATQPMGGAPPPPEPDPATGEVPSEQYRAWLREWLAFAESYDG
jgi:hypothetical protein